MYSIIKNVITTTPKVTKIEQILQDAGQPKYRIKQLINNIYNSRFVNYSEMTDLPLEFRTQLEEIAPRILELTFVKQTDSEGTIKVLFNTQDKNPVEAVFMEYSNHSTLCISTQSGCSLGCKFCATGKMGFNQNLSVDEVCDQVLYFIKQGKRPDNIVVMGMGEPLANPDIFTILGVLNNKDLFGYGQRKISVSTVGLVPELKQLINLFPQINIAFSLHSPFEEQRESLMPINKAYKISEVFDVLKRHVTTNKRKVFISYIMLRDVNDTDEHAEGIAKLINNIGNNKYLFHVNLIKFHTFEGSEFVASSLEKIHRFSNVLKRHGINNTTRKDFAEEIKGACGQLASDDRIS